MRALLVIALLLATAPAPADAPRRIVSINLCADQLLLDLADQEQVLGLSPYARDAARSWAAGKAAELPVLSGTAEEIMMLRPDLVLSGSFTKRATQEFIRARGVRLEEFDTIRSIADAREQMLRAARLVGREARGEARAAALDAALARLRSVSDGRRLRVLPIARRGWAAGRAGLTGDLMAAAGLANAAGDAVGPEGGFIPLEAIVALRPDALLVAGADSAAEDQGQALLLHPAIAALFPPERRIVMPEFLTNCGGPMLAEAIDRLAAQIAAIWPR